MNGKILFLIINDEVKYLQNSTMDHKEWYLSLGLDPDQFDSVVRGFIDGGKIIFYKGSNFSYDEEVMKVARIYTPKIRLACSNPSLEAYCGISIQEGEKWEPICKVSDNEMINDAPESPKPAPVVATNNKSPIIELKNNYEDANFRKVAVIVTAIILVLELIIKIILFRQKTILNSSHFLDVLFVLSQWGLLGATVYGYLKNRSFAKYSGLVASFLIILTLDFVDVVVGVLYFLFCIDQNYFVKVYQFIQKFLNSKKTDKKS